MKPLKRFWDLMASGELQLVAAALSFSTVLSLIPFMAVSLATLQYVGGLDTIYPKVEAAALRYFEGPTGTEGTKIIQKVFRRIQAGRMGAWGAVALVLASVFLINDIERGIQRIWNLHDRRPVYQRIFLYWVAMVLFPAGLAMYVAIGSLKGFSGAAVPLSVTAMNLLILFSILFFIYKVVPNTRVSVLSALFGALVSTTGLSMLYSVFKWMSKSLLSWDKLYGSFAAVPGLLIWILLTWYVILIGAAFTASFRK